MEKYQAKKEEQEAHRRLLAEQKGKPTVTKGGKAIKLFANIGSVSDLPAAMSNDAGGCLLYTSFGLYNILGMGKANLAHVLIWENVMSFLISLGGGLTVGILLSKFSELCLLKLVHMETGFRCV